MAVELSPHQIKAANELSNGKILKGVVGSGKSRTALYYYFTKILEGDLKTNGKGEFSPPVRSVDIYIITTAKKRESGDWEAEASKFAISSSPKWSYGGVKLTVDSWNNITNYKDIKNAFFIFDEQRLVGSGAWVKAFLTIAKHNSWIVLSATPGDNWMDYVPIFIANGYYRNRTEFLRRHVVFNHFKTFPSIDHYVEISHLDSILRRIIVEVPFEKHTVRHVENIIVDYDKEKFDRVYKDRWNIYEDRPIKDISELFRVMRKLVNTDTSRIGAILELMEKHKRLIIFYNFDYELSILRMITGGLFQDTPIDYAEWNGHKHQPIPTSDRWVYLVQYTAGAEGWNCTTTNTVVLYSLNYSYKINEQVKGRIDRMDTPYIDLYYYVLRSGSVIDISIAKAIAQKKNFNERSLVAA